MTRLGKYGAGLAIAGLAAGGVWFEHASPRRANSRPALAAHAFDPQPTRPAGRAGDTAALAPASFEEMVQSLRGADVPRLLAYLAGLPAGEERTTVAAELLRRWARENPAAAIDYVVADTTAVQPLLAGLLSTPLREQTTAERLDDVSREAGAGVLGMMFADWAQRDPGSAASKAWQLGSIRQRELMLRVVLETWAGENLSAAVVWMGRAPAGPERDAVLSGLAPEWAARDPGAAGAFAAALPDGTARERLLATVAAAWAAQDMPATIAWIKTLPESGGRAEVTRNALGRLAADDLAAAADWLPALPAGAAQHEGAELILNQWAARDLRAAVTWAQALPPGALRDDALRALAGAWVAHDPQGALRAALETTDATARSGLLADVARHWLERDPTAARAWLASAAAPSELRARLGPP